MVIEAGMDEADPMNSIQMYPPAPRWSFAGPMVGHCLGDHPSKHVPVKRQLRFRTRGIRMIVTHERDDCGPTDCQSCCDRPSDGGQTVGEWMAFPCCFVVSKKMQ